MKRDQCEECGEGEFELIDGVYYCCFCSAVNMKAREVEVADDSAFFQLSVRGTLKAKEKKDEEGGDKKRPEEEKKRGRKKAEDVEEKLVDSDDEIGERAISGADFPTHLRTVGYRLSTFTKLVTQIAYLLKENYQVPVEVMDTSYFILQEYFRRFGAAFFDGETGEEGEEDLFISRTKKTVKQIAQEQKDARVKVEETRKSLVEERLSQLPAWRRTIDAEQVKREVDEIDIPMETLQVLKVEPTLLRVKTINAAGFVYVGIDMALCIVYSAMLLCGCKWIQLSELFRWYREGRFFVTILQLRALNFSVRYDREKISQALLSRCFGSPPFYAILSGSEQYRVLSFLAQFTEIPPSTKSMSFPTVCSRLVYNLNLPTAFLRQLKVLIDLLPPVHGELGADYFSSLLPLSKEFQETALHRQRMGFASFFRGCFGDTTNSMSGIQHPTRFFYWQIPTPEVKAAALLLLALKLVFGLDDSREHQMEEEAEGGHDEEMFNFGSWLTQLRLRTHVRRGRSVESVLSKTFSMDEDDEKAGPNLRDYHSGRFECAYRLYPFDCCTPNRLMNCREKTHFEDLFTADVTNKPFDMSRDSLFAPLLHEPNSRERLGDILLDDTIDREMAQLFFTTFSSHHINFKETVFGRHTKPQFIARGGEDLDEGKEEQTPIFRRLFPSSGGYQRFPCPSIQCLRVDTGSEGDEKEVDRWVISRPQIVFILRASRHFFSANFSALLKYLALAIDETEELLYFTFLFQMVEAGRLLYPENADTAARQEETSTNAGGENEVDDSDSDEGDDEKTATSTADQNPPRSSMHDELAEEFEAEEVLRARPFKVMRIPSARALATLFDRYW